MRRRGYNFHPLEVQALLKACLTYRVEEFRQAGKTTGHLFYDIQQEMAKYGDFPERPLVHLRAYYRTVQRRYKQGRKPYPPEARAIWGALENETDASENDAAWNALMQKKIILKSACMYLTKPELATVINEAIEKNVENLTDEHQKEAFESILTTLHSKKYFLGKSAEDLFRNYRRLKKRFSKHPNEFPESASKLWSIKRGEAFPDTVEDSQVSDFAAEDVPDVADSPVPQEVEGVKAEEIIDTEIVCSICQAYAYESKHLFRDVYQNQTYAEIIKQTLSVNMLWNGNSPAQICSLCSTYIEGLPNFWNQCRESCTKLNIEMLTKEEPLVQDTAFWETASKAESPSHDKEEVPSFGCDDLQANDSLDEITFDDVLAEEIPNATVEVPLEETQPKVKSNVRKDTKKASSNLTREELNMLKFKESFPESVNRRLWRNKPKQCELCGRTVLDLKSHLETHYNNKPYACDFCPRRFNTRPQLNQHRNRHTQARKYPCSYCDAVLSTWKNHDYHVKKHIVEMNNLSFNCDQCDAKFKVEKNLRDHIKFKHNNMRKYQCSQCDFATINKVRLRNHVRSIHSQERPFQCPYCNFTSNSNTGYFIHFKRHKKSGEATEYTIKCGYCEETFLKDSHFEKHIVQAHPDRAITV